MWAVGMAHQTMKNCWSELLRSLWKEDEKAAIVWEIRAACFRYKKYEKSFMRDNMLLMIQLPPKKINILKKWISGIGMLRDYLSCASPLWTADNLPESGKWFAVTLPQYSVLHNDFLLHETLRVASWLCLSLSCRLWSGREGSSTPQREKGKPQKVLLRK